MRSQFVVQTYGAMAQWVKDNKFVESGLENWALVDLGYNYHNIKDNLNENAETNRKRFSIREVLLLCQLIFFHAIVYKLAILFPLGFSWFLFHKGFFTLYSSLRIILTLHLLFIWDSTWVFIPSNTSSSPLWIVITSVSLFRCLLHINMTRKVVTVHLMRWQQLCFRSFVLSSLLF